MSTKGHKEPYTVLVARSDDYAEPFGQDNFLAHVEADGTEDAAWQARAACAETMPGFDLAEREDDLFVIAVFRGHHDDVQPDA